MEDIYKEFPYMENNKDIIEPLLDKLNGKSYFECEQIFNHILHLLKTKATLQTKP